MQIIQTDFDKIVADIMTKYKALQKSRGVDYIVNPNDLQSLIGEACAYRLLLQTQSVNWAFSQLFLNSAIGANLDRLAENLFGIKRLPGAKPTAKIELNLSAPANSEMVIPTGFLLASTDNVTAKATTDIKVLKGKTEVIGTFELQKNIRNSEIKTQILVNPLPYLSKVTQKTAYAGGDDPEDDARLRIRCIDSLNIKSTAGSVDAYEYYTRTADSRIKEVKVFSPKPCEVNVVYWAELMDEIMKKRVNAALNDGVRPLSDLVKVKPAKESEYSVEATVTIPKNTDQSAAGKKAEENLKKLRNYQKIGQDITLFQISNLAAIDENIKNCVVNLPTKDVVCDNETIPILKNVKITVAEYGE